MELLRGFKKNITGASCCEVYKDEKSICQIFYDTSLFLSYSSNQRTAIHTQNYSLISEYDISTTLIPGRKRYITLRDSQEPVVSIVYNNNRNYSIITQDQNINVTVDEDGYYFVGPSEDIATVILNEESIWFPGNDRSGFYEREFTCVLFQPVDELTLAVILAFHHLRFGF